MAGKELYQICQLSRVSRVCFGINNDFRDIASALQLDSSPNVALVSAVGRLDPGTVSFSLTLLLKKRVVTLTYSLNSEW